MDIQEAKIRSDLEDIMYKLNLKDTLVQPEEISIITEEITKYVIKEVKQSRIDTLKEHKKFIEDMGDSDRFSSGEELLIEIDTELKKARK